MTVPEGAQLSEDGHYWWDGSDWQPVAGAGANGAADGGSNGEVTADELSQIQSADQISERFQPYFQPDYDKVPDDESWAEVDADLSED